MLHRYRAAFEPRGSLSFSLAGLLGRLPSSMVGLGLVLVLSVGGNYGTAGTLVGILALAGTVGGPLQGRLADRFGQARVLVPTTLVFGVSLAGLVGALQAGSGFAVLAVLAAVNGAAGPTTGTLARSRWTALHGRGGRLQTAYAVEAVFDEVVFVTGPVLAAVLATRGTPVLALVVGGVAGVAGSLLMAAQRQTEPPIRDEPAPDGGVRTEGSPIGPTPPSAVPGTKPRAWRRARRHPPLTRPAFPLRALMPLFVVQLTIGTVFGSNDVVVVAAMSAAGERGRAGFVLACFAAGSLLSGIVVGAVEWRMGAMRRVRVCTVALGLATLLLPLNPSVRLLPAVGFVVGLTIAPALVAVAAAVQRSVPAARLTEAMALGTSFLIGGFSVGSALAGHLVDAVGPHRAFWQAAAAGMLAIAVVVVPVAVRRARAALARSRADRTGGATTPEPDPEPGPAHAAIGRIPRGSVSGGGPVATDRRPVGPGAARRPPRDRIGRPRRRSRSG